MDNTDLGDIILLIFVNELDLDNSNFKVKFTYTKRMIACDIFSGSHYISCCFRTDPHCSQKLNVYDLCIYVHLLCQR